MLCMNEGSKKREWNTKRLTLSFFALSLLLQSQGFCATDPNAITALDAINGELGKILFSPWVKYPLLAFSGIMGVIKAAAAGSFVPFLLWAGIGFTIAYIPNLIKIISTVGP